MSGDRDHHWRPADQGRGEENSDAAAAAALLAAEDSPAEVYGDSAYGTGDLRAAMKEAAHMAIIKHRPLKPAVEGGFTLDEFTDDETAGTVTCPAGVTSPSASPAAAARCVPAGPRARPAVP